MPHSTGEYHTHFSHYDLKEFPPIFHTYMHQKFAQSYFEHRVEALCWALGTWVVGADRPIYNTHALEIFHELPHKL